MPIKILFVDDEPNFEPLIRQIFKKQIRRKEFDLIFASDGLEALDKLQAEPEIDIVLTDIRMPKMNGLTLLARLKELKPGLNPVLTTVIISAYDDMENIRKAMNLGAFDFLTKPIDLHDIRVTLDKTIQHVQQLKKALEQERLAREALRRVNEELEGRVAERTAELSAANAALKNSNKQLKQEITERKRTEEALRESEERYRQSVENSPNPIFSIDREGIIQTWNRACEQLFQYGPEEIIGQPYHKLLWNSEDRSVVEATLVQVWQGHSMSDQDITYQSKDGMHLFTVSRLYPLRDAKGDVQGCVLANTNITERKRAEAMLKRDEERLRALLQLSKMETATEEELVEYALEEMVRLTNSKIGYLHFVHPHQKGIELFAWSKGALENCTAAKTPHYPLDAAGIWADCIRERRPVIHNDYPNLPHKKGLPEGHSPVTRHVSVPIFDGGLILAVTGVGNKETPYDELDVQQLTLFMSSMWQIVKRRSAEREIRQRVAQLEALREIGLEFTAQLDLDTLLHSITSHAMKLLEGNASGLSLYRPARDILEVTVSIGDVVVPLGSAFRRGEGFTGKVWEAGEPLLVGIYPHWEGRAARYEKLPVAAAVGVPVRWGPAGAGEFLGVLVVTSDSPNVFSPADVELLSLFATQAAIAIKNAQLYAQAVRDAQTKTILLKEVNHRVKNNLAAIAGMLYIEKRYAERSQGQRTHQAIMADLINRIEGLATVHHLLSASEWSPLPLGELTRQVIDSALQVLPPDKQVLTDISSTVPVQVTPKQANSLAMVINELATNVVKYAVPPQGQTARITARIALDLDGETILFKFRDNGPGFPEEVLRSERQNVGLYLIQNITCGDLRGEITLHNDNGAVITIRFPASV